MKYHTLSTSSLATEGKKSTLTLYTGPDFLRDKIGSTTEAAIIRAELEMAQKALKLQTRRCRELVAEYTRKLQAKELQVLSEKHLREEQLSLVLRSLLIFEARLRQEQTFIRHQLNEKDNLIQRQQRELKKARFTIQFCKTCSQLYTCNIDSCDSSSEYCPGSQDTWESSSELYGSLSESGRPEITSSGEENVKQEYDDGKITYEKNRQNKTTDSYKRSKKSHTVRRPTGTYFEVLKLRESKNESFVNDASSEPELGNTADQIEEVSGRIENLFAESPTNESTFSERMNSLHGIRKSVYNDSNSSDEQAYSSLSVNSECDTTIITHSKFESEVDNKNNMNVAEPESAENVKTDSEANPIIENLNNEEKELSQKDKGSLITDTIIVFDGGEAEVNDNWYTSNSDPEDDEHRDIYRNNPVLECMNQILLQNINDAINSPPKSPDLDRSPKQKTQKRVKFSDENEDEAQKEKSVSPVATNIVTEKADSDVHSDYYETPIQGGGNFYETPQSIYSNDYEQILSNCGSDNMHIWSNGSKAISPTSKLENRQEKKINRMSIQKLTLAKSNNFDDSEQKNHYYIDMDSKTPSPVPRQDIVKKTKVARTPPALPPKPANLISKLRIQNALLTRSCENLDDISVDSEPDYCSISELNLPTEKVIISKLPHPQNINETTTHIPNPKVSVYEPISLDSTLSKLISKNTENTSLQAPKQAQVKQDRIVTNMASIAQINMLKNKKEPEIPKLPQVSEIIIPEENDEKRQNEHISQDNYIKNNSQLLKQKAGHQSTEKIRGSIIVGTSVSSIISGFNNNQQLLSQIRSRKSIEKPKLNERLFSSFEYNKTYEKQHTSPVKVKPEVPNFDKFDLSQNFEEFNLDDCEIGEDFQSSGSNSLNYNVNEEKKVENFEPTKENLTEPVEKRSLTEKKSNTSVEIVRATKGVQGPHNIYNLQQLQKNLHSQRNSIARENEPPLVPVISHSSEPSYEHFLECTGLSSKSILTPSRMLSNHKSMLKPKDIKLRSKVKSASVYEYSGGTVKYWSEPYL